MSPREQPPLESNRFGETRCYTINGEGQQSRVTVAFADEPAVVLLWKERQTFE